MGLTRGEGKVVIVTSVVHEAVIARRVQKPECLSIYLTPMPCSEDRLAL